MKAEINKKGLLILQSETIKETKQIIKWVKTKGAKIIIPKKRTELATCRFESFDIAIFFETHQNQNLYFHI